ncbi:TIGR02186 family protein [Desulforhopalus singaporensis]|uniref:Transmembrane protein (Alph_Pro_TM) n=1 Tax=Desulforhopalus singaporensis TaxID=91360 RepID=A0A1H0KKG2_9BACT|nr:TIGR02186 family protein [Desulforhopalus singaporensis]SDO56231.1 conserved hypothetical protein [Desulforhopalus singaporensis]
MSKVMKMLSAKGVLVLALVLLPWQAMAVHVSPEQVKISATYDGQDVFVTGEVQGDEEAVVQIVGHSTAAEFARKGKVGGVLWMTVEHIRIGNAPNVYLLYLPKTLDDWRLHSDPRWNSLNLDFSTLLAKARIEPEPQNKEALFNDFIKLKTRDSLYQLVGDAVRYTSDSGGNKEFKARIHIPAKIPVAAYEVRVLRIKKDGQVAAIEKGKLELEETGFPEFIRKMAFKNSLLYGVLSVGIAILAGLFMGILFRDRGSAH